MNWKDDPSALNVHRVISIGHDQSSVCIIQIKGEKPSFIIRDDNGGRVVLDWLNAWAVATELRQLINEY